MKRWTVRRPPLPNGFQLPDIVVQADRIELSEGVAAFYSETPHQASTARYPMTVIELVRAFGVGQWRDIEPLASPPEETPDPEAGVIRGPEVPPGSEVCICGHQRKDHFRLAGDCLARRCECTGVVQR